MTYQRIVAKFGTALLTNGSDNLDKEIMSKLVAQLARLHGEGREVILVSSGAMAAGRSKLGLAKRDRDIPFKQVLASVGQHRLMDLYEQLFAEHSITVAQALLAKADLLDRAAVNENDVVAVDEIREAVFGDNDNLSAMVANLVDADLLLILTDIGGLYTADPRRHPGARLIPEVKVIDAEIERLAADTPSQIGTGGMTAKVEAAKLATSSGVTVIIADGRESDVILKVVNGEAIGTRFLPVTNRLESRQRWMLSGLSTKGKLVVDSGAVLALRDQKRSLLAAGVKDVEGKFKRGDIVNICDAEGCRLACGITNYSSKDIAAIKGVHSEKIATILGYDYGSEVVHRNNLVVV